MSEPNPHSVAKTLDTTGLLCPEPVMLLHKAMREAERGDVVEVIATDPSTQRDIPKFCLFLGHELVEQKQDVDKFIFYVKKAGDPSKR